MSKCVNGYFRSSTRVSIDDLTSLRISGLGGTNERAEGGLGCALGPAAVSAVGRMHEPYTQPFAKHWRASHMLCTRLHHIVASLPVIITAVRNHPPLASIAIPEDAMQFVLPHPVSMDGCEDVEMANPSVVGASPFVRKPTYIVRKVRSLMLVSLSSQHLSPTNLARKRRRAY